MIVTMLGLCGWAMVSVSWRSAEAIDARSRARALAESGLQLAAHAIDKALVARTSPDDATLVSDRGVGGGRLWATADRKLTISNVGLLDADLNVTAFGTWASARQMLGATITSRNVPLSSLGLAMYAGKDLVVSNCELWCDGPVGAAGATYTVNGSLVGEGLAIRASASNAQPLYDLPVPADVQAFYTSVGTPISRGSLSSNRLRRVTLSASLNPFGPPNPLGVYVIDCQGQNVTVQDVRVLGTLVLLNPGTGTIIGPEVHIAPARPDMPALIVLGHATIDTGTTPMSEASEGVNFNPPGAPYRAASDADQSDRYPSTIEGLVYVSGNVRLSAGTQLRGRVLAGGSIIVGSFPLLTKIDSASFVGLGATKVSTSIIVGGAVAESPVVEGGDPLLGGVSPLLGGAITGFPNIVEVETEPVPGSASDPRVRMNMLPSEDPPPAFRQWPLFRVVPGTVRRVVE